MQAAVDLGLTNTDIIVRQDDTSPLQEFILPTMQHEPMMQLRGAIKETGWAMDDFEWVAVTGGQYRSLPEQSGAVRLVKVNEVDAIGRGGLHLARLERALVVSAGSGTAMVAARGGESQHITGSAVGGGTLQGLGRLILGTADALEIDALASQGDANVVDLTLIEAIGGTVGDLPKDANAVNFGRVARQDITPSPEDTAAGLVRVVAQVIAVISINAARDEQLETIIVIGHLVDLPSICRELDTVAGYYSADIRVPPQPGFGTAVGALLYAECGKD